MSSSTIASVQSWIFFLSLFFDFEKKTPRCFLNGTIQANGGTTVEITVEIPDPTDRSEEDVISLTTAFRLLLQRVYATMACHFFKCNLFFLIADRKLEMSSFACATSMRKFSTSLRTTDVATCLDELVNLLKKFSQNKTPCWSYTLSIVL